ncbi:unnamed protein product [Prunus brigantina]
MSDSKSPFESEPNAFEGESSDGLFDSNSEAVSLGAEDGEDTDVEILGECPSSVPTHGIGKGLMTQHPMSLAVVYRNGTYLVAEPSSCPRVSVVFPNNPRVPIGVLKENLFSVDYLGPNKITKREIAKYRAEYCIPYSIRMRISGPTESLSKPKGGEVVFFTNVLLQGVRWPLQPAVQRILAQIGYSPGQYNPNFWVALMGVVTAFDMAKERGPSYEQFSYLYSVTKSKSADHEGKLKQPSPTQSEIRQIHRVRLKVPAVERVYPKFLFTANLIEAQLVSLLTDARKAAGAKRMNESSKRRLMLGLQGKKKNRQPKKVPMPSAGVDPEDQTLTDRLRQHNAGTVPSGAVAAGVTPSQRATTEALSSKVARKRPETVDLDAKLAPKRGRQLEPLWVILAAEDNDAHADPITLACPSKTV